jgi:FkbM family methyltransferase
LLATLVRHVLLARVSNPFVLQIGANDGTRNDPLSSLFGSCGFRGILVEPQPHVFAELKKKYSGCSHIVCENVAIGPVDGTITLFQAIDEDGRAIHDQLTSYSEEKLNNALKYFGLKATVAPIEVPVKRPSSLLEAYGVKKVDILIIDTEGMDGQILHSFDFEQYRPSIVQCEYFHLTDGELRSCLELLRRHGFIYNVNGYDLVAWSTRECSLP